MTKRVPRYDILQVTSDYAPPPGKANPPSTIHLKQETALKDKPNLVSPSLKFLPSLAQSPISPLHAICRAARRPPPVTTGLKKVRTTDIDTGRPSQHTTDEHEARRAGLNGAAGLGATESRRRLRSGCMSCPCPCPGPAPFLDLRCDGVRCWHRAWR
jgi:hypothetical protein